MDKIKRLKGLEGVHPLDYYFSQLMAELGDSDDDSLMLATCLLSQATANKHVCLFLPAFSGKVVLDGDNTHAAIQCPDLHQWIKSLRTSPVIGRPGEFKPLILDERNRLYLYRYWKYEKDLSHEIHNRADGIIPVDTHQLKKTLHRLFPDESNPSVDMQKIAALICTLKRICVITGGPGTGKTTTVAKILAVLLEQSPHQNVNILMAAPTGKAAIRLRESIISAKKGINASEEIKNAIPEAPQTIHRMLKPVFGSSQFKFNQNNPLNADIVVVDEASMVDIALMTKLIQAVPTSAHLILIGDKDQLASVETGSVLGDICEIQNKKASNRWHDFLIHWMTKKDATDLNHNQLGNTVEDCIVRLTKTYRFADHKNMEAFINIVKSGDFEALKNFLKSSDPSALEINHFNDQKQFHEKLEENILNGYSSYLMAKTISDALIKFEKYKILCAQNKGHLGVEGINRIAESVLMRHHLIDPSVQWYKGRPILINSNDYSLDVFNGDMGIIWPESDKSDSELYAYFPGKSDGIKKVLPQRLPEHETGFAMTIHKTQGSEFDSVLIILPTQDTPILTRELLYTGITRARKKLSVWTDPHILKTAMSRKIQRYSGLSDLLSQQVSEET